MFDFIIKLFAIMTVFYVIWALFDCLKNEKQRPYFWVIVILLTGIIGAIPYSIRASKRRGSFSSFGREFSFKD